MRGDLHSNWIAGDWRPAEREQEFELRGGEPREQQPGRWPRSGAEDVQLALAAAGRAPRGERGARLAGLERALSRLEPRTGRGVHDPVALALGLRRRELAPHRAAGIAAARALLAASPGGAAEAGGAALVRARAAELFEGLLTRLVEPVLAGRPVLLVSDPACPELAEDVALALEAGGLDDGRIALLHDDGLSVLRAAAAAPEVAEVRASGTRRELRELERFARRGARLEGARLATAPFGAGVLESTAAGPALALARLRDRAAAVLAGDPLEERAFELARAAFGRGEALGGQLAAAVGRVHCHERAFSRFSELLLEEVEALAATAAPVRVIDPELREVVERRRRLGLDEGATLILGPAEGAAGSRRSRGAATLFPSVFTNAEPHMRLAKDTRPAPVLVLMRAPSDAAAQERVAAERAASQA